MIASSVFFFAVLLLLSLTTFIGCIISLYMSSWNLSVWYRDWSSIFLIALIFIIVDCLGLVVGLVCRKKKDNVEKRVK